MRFMHMPFPNLESQKKRPAGLRTAASTTSLFIFAAGLPAVNRLCRRRGIWHDSLLGVSTSASRPTTSFSRCWLPRPRSGPPSARLARVAQGLLAADVPGRWSSSGLRLLPACCCAA